MVYFPLSVSLSTNNGTAVNGNMAKWLQNMADVGYHKIVTDIPHNSFVILFEIVIGNLFNYNITLI